MRSQLAGSRPSIAALTASAVLATLASGTLLNQSSAASTVAGSSGDFTRMAPTLPTKGWKASGLNCLRMG